ncbi:hypothetical protein [Candidatus Cardinium hertigii]|nr:hypothetical protein [Candidatus Cardinium hertigii]
MALAEALKQSNTITAIDLEGNCIGNSGAAVLAGESRFNLEI